MFTDALNLHHVVCVFACSVGIQGILFHGGWKKDFDGGQRLYA